MTNQNDTQDEAERLAEELAMKAFPMSFHGSERSWGRWIAKEAYRAGVASREAEIDTTEKKALFLTSGNQLGKTTLQIKEIIRNIGLDGSIKVTSPDVMALEKQLSLYRAEVERLQNCFDECVKNRDGWIDNFRSAITERDAEKQKAERFMDLLREAVEFMKRPPAISTGDRAWHQHDVIIQIDKTLSDYSTYSGDGGKG